MPSLWRIHKALHAALLAAIAGAFDLDHLMLNHAAFMRHLCEPPRRRIMQAHAARRLLHA